MPSLDRYFDAHDRGIMTVHELCGVTLYAMLDAGDDTDAFAVLDTLPGWFRADFRTYFASLCERKPKWKRFYIGDSRTPEQIAADVERDDAFFLRCGDAVLSRL